MENMSVSLLKSLVILLNLSAFATLQAMAGSLGNGTSGGGNVQSERVEFIESLLKNNGEILRADLKALVREVQKFPVRGQRTLELQNLITDGLLEDIEGSPYVPSQRCIETNADGTESVRDAATLRGVRNAPICLNYENLAQKLNENNAEAQLVGLLAHEHARHFNLEDTTPFKQHPLAIWVASRFAPFSISTLGGEIRHPGIVKKTHELLDWQSEFTRWLKLYRRYYDSTLFIKDAVYVSQPNVVNGNIIPEHHVYTSDPDSVFIIIREVSGDCGNRQLVDFHSHKTFPIAVGTIFPMTKSYHLYQESGFLGRGEAKPGCKISFLLRSSFGEIELPEGNVISRAVSLYLDVYKMDLSDRSSNRTSPEWLESK
jgi:hypothetical protein